MITSAKNPKFKLVRTLMGRPKERREEGAFIAEGIRLVEEAVAANWPFRYVLYGGSLSKRGKDLVAQINSRGIETDEVVDHLLENLSDTGNTQGILAVLEQYTPPRPNTRDFFIILDRIRDPGNLGTLLRSAEAAGVQATFLPPETTDAYAPKVVRAGMGAHFRLPIYTLSWESIREETRGLKLILAEMDGQSCWETDLRSPLALIVGGEAEGASPQAKSIAEATISIPMPGHAESLNAAAAGAVLIFEVVRQRKKG